MTDKLTELALLTACTNDFQSQMMVAEANDEMEDSHWMASLRTAFSALKELQWEIAGACLLRMR